MHETTLLSPLQRRLAGYALTTVAVGVLVAAVIAALWLAGYVLSVFSAVLWPLVLAGICSLLVRPVVTVFEKRLKLGRAWAILLLFFLAAVAALALIAWVLPLFIRQLTGFVGAIPGYFAVISARIAEQFPDLSGSVQNLLDTPWVKSALAQAPNLLKPLMSVSGAAMSKAGDTLLTIASVCAGAAVLPIYLFYFLKSDRDWADDFGGELTFLPPRLREDCVFLIREFRGFVLAFFRGQLLIGLVMGLLYGLGFTAAGLHFGFFLGLSLGFLNIIPYLGTIIGLVVILPLAYFQTGGGWPTFGWVVLVFVLVQLLESYLLTPKIMGEKTGLHPLLIIISILFWGVALGGILGMVLAVPLTAFLLTFWHLVRTRYLPNYAPENTAGK